MQKCCKAVQPEMTMWPMRIECRISKATNTHSQYVIKGKTVPLQAQKGPDGSRKLRFPDFVTTAQDGFRLSALQETVHSTLLLGCFYLLYML